MSLIAEGKFEAVAVPVEVDGSATYAQFGETSTGKLLVSVRCRLMTGANAGAELPWEGYLTDSAIERTIKALRTFGFTGNDLSAIVDQELTNRVEVVIEHEEYKEKTYARIRWINQLGTRRFKAVDRSALKALDAELRGRIAAIDAEASAPTPPPADAPPVSDDDIPF